MSILLPALSLLARPVLLVFSPVLVTLSGAAYDRGHDWDTEDRDYNQADTRRYSDAQSKILPYTNVGCQARSPDSLHLTKRLRSDTAPVCLRLTTPGLSSRPAKVQLASLDLSSEVLQVLTHLALGVGEGVSRELSDLTTRRIGVIHRDVYTRAALGNLLKADLSRGLDLIVVGTVPADTALGAHLGSLGIELNIGAKRALYLPVARLLVKHTDFFDVAHDLRKVL